jgi:hypothetical protein
MVDRSVPCELGEAISYLSRAAQHVTYVLLCVPSFWCVLVEAQLTQWAIIVKTVTNRGAS